MVDISERQQEFLDFLRNYEEMHGRPPTFREIAIGMGVSSKGSVSAMINTLASMGLVDRAKATPRGTRLFKVPGRKA